jgi:hypothetical protein
MFSSPDTTPAGLAGNCPLNVEVKFGLFANGRNSHEVLDNKGVSGEKTKIYQKSISFKQKELD